MQELFDSLKNFKPKKFDPKYYIRTKGNEILCLANQQGTDTTSVDKQTYLMLLGQGHQNFYYEQGKIIRKPPAETKRKYSVLLASSNGLHFANGDPYWPTGTGEGGHAWQTPSE